MEIHHYGNCLRQQIDDIQSRARLLRELTYTYIDIGGGKKFNTTIFTEYLGENGVSIGDFMTGDNVLSQDFFLELKKVSEKKIDEDIFMLSEYLKECEEGEKDSISLYVTALQFTKESLDFELEEAGCNHVLSEDEVHKKVTRLRQLDAEIFGEHVSENPEFLKQTYAYLEFQINTYGNNLSQSQLKHLKWGFEKIGRKICLLDDNFNLNDIPPHKIGSVPEEYRSLSEIKIPRDDYVRIFDIFFEISDVPQRSKIGDFTSFTDSDEVYGIPNSSNYEEKSLGEILRLAPHETGHYINLGVTQSKGDGKRRGDMIKEEGLAKFTEAIIQGIPIEEINPITFSAPSVILANLLPGDEFRDFEGAYLELLVKSGEHSSKRDVEKSFLRKKRGFSKKYSGSSNKDASYSLGLFSVLQYLKNGEGNIGNLFGGKISMSDVKSGRFFPDDFGNKYVSHILLSELIVFYLLNKGKIKEDGGNLHTEFVSYLKEKYKYFSDEFSLFSEVEKFTIQNKRKVIEILKIVKENSQKS